MALGGCRLWRYPDWRDGLADALRLAEGMTDKFAVAGLPYGGGKTVVVADESIVDRRAVMHDVGDVERGIVWAPDYAVSAGGAIYATALELQHLPAEQAMAQVRGIGATVAGLLATAGFATPAARVRWSERGDGRIAG